MAAGTNIALLEASERAERRRFLALPMPALLLTAVICIVPVGILFWVSFVGPEGFTLENYTRILENPGYLKILRTTFSISITITILAILLGFPLAYYISTLPDRAAAICLGLVLVPFWTSLLVRTYAWLVLLQRQGLINDFFLWLGVIDEPMRLAYNRFGTTIGMLHIVLPFFVLPMFAAIKSLDRDWLRAAANLGASPVRAFWTVLVPLTIPGLVAGALLVFVYSLGFYVTPEILGGGRVTMVAMKVQQNATIYAD
ncbi:MAG: ABC transporter permease, partial [Dongiaceae bacterium]